MTTVRRNALLRWLPAILWMGAIFILSGRQRDEIPSFGWWDWFAKKGAHFAAYAVLAILICWANKNWRWAFFIAAVYAVSDEWHQTFVPTRNGNVFDVLVDWLGAGSGLVAYTYWMSPWWERLARVVKPRRRRSP